MRFPLLPILATTLLVCSSHGEQPTPTPNESTASNAAEVDNTKRNSAEQNKNTDTAEKQSDSKEDLAMVQKIRQAVEKEGSLSMNAKNVKIIVRDGKVMLRGPIDSEQEKATIAARASEAAGKDNVDNQLEVKTDKK
jgi:hyperosmotically inducible protein